MSTGSIFHGCGTALVTPFAKDLKVDYDCFRRLVARQIASNIDFLLVLGSTAETSSLTNAECLELLKIAVDENKGRVPILVGAGTNNLDLTLARFELFNELNRHIDGFLVVTPYYNKPTQDGLFTYYQLLAKKAPRPIMLYNVPGRTGVNLQAETVLKLSSVPNIIGIKEASGNYAQCARILNQMPSTFKLFAGDDNMVLALMATGAAGLISIASNLVPKPMAHLKNFIEQNNWEQARTVYRQLEPLFTGCFLESNPIPIKWAMSHAKLIKPWLRLPLMVASDHTQKALAKIVHNLDIE